MTEEEAKTKWCPFAGQPRRELNEDTDKPLEDCIGSQCMAWRWHDGPEDDVDGDTRIDGKLAKATGFCGLAGAPA